MALKAGRLGSRFYIKKYIYSYEWGRAHKVQISLEGQKIWKENPNFFNLVFSKKIARFFQNVVTFSEYMNFIEFAVAGYDIYEINLYFFFF